MLLEMSEEKARHMLELSRTLRWEFPTSQGTPIIRGQAASQDVEQATKERESYANAARVLLECSATAITEERSRGLRVVRFSGTWAGFAAGGKA